MFEDLLVQLDELGVTYTEDESSLSIDIADVDKSILIDIITILTGYEFDINESSITVYSGEPMVEEDASYDEEAYLDDALAQM